MRNFFNHHKVPKNTRKGFLPRNSNSFFSELKTSEKNLFAFGNFFSKKVFEKKVSYCRASLERHKSAPYLRLKNNKRTSKCQVFLYSTQKTQKLKRIGAPGGYSDFSTSIVAKHQKMKRRHFGDFSTSFLSPGIKKKLKEDSFRNFFFKKSPNAEKTERGIP